MVGPAHVRDRDEATAEVVIQNPLMREEVKRATAQAERADTYRNISGYLNWVTTGLLGISVALGLAAGGVLEMAGMASWLTAPFVGSVGLMAALPAAGWLAIGAGALSLVALAGNIYVSNKATRIEQYNDVVKSDIDSQNQAHRMVQAFAKAQTQGHVHADDSSPMTSNGPSWASRVPGQAQAQGSWQERVVAQAQREEVQNLAAVRS
jgi:hypothetical protein